MTDFEKNRNELLAKTVVKNLEKRNMKAFYATDGAEAVKIALNLIEEGSTITMGGCASAKEIGLEDALKKGNYNYVDRDTLRDRKEAAAVAFAADVFLTSCNAMSKDGVLINIDAQGNRVAATAFGPGKVIYIVGINKICADVDSAVKRARNTAAPVNAQRFPVDTPCKKVGHCINCTSPDCICAQILFTRYNCHDGRINVILVNENLGF